jgi:hypothetical protein
MEKLDKILYYLYIIIGILYVIVKILFVSFGYLHTEAIMHGVIVAIPTTLIGILSLIEHKKGYGTVLHILAIILPILVLSLTPPYMYLKMGPEKWLTEGRLEVLIIYEIFAVIQIVLSMVLYKKIRDV